MEEEKKYYTVLWSDGFAQQLGTSRGKITEEEAFRLLSEYYNYHKKNLVGDYLVYSLYEGHFHKTVPEMVNRLVAVYDDGIPCSHRTKGLGFDYVKNTEKFTNPIHHFLNDLKPSWKEVWLERNFRLIDWREYWP